MQLSVKTNNFSINRKVLSTFCRDAVIRLDQRLGLEAVVVAMHQAQTKVD